MLRDLEEQRIYFRARKPNPLFEQWLEHWLDEARKKDSSKRLALSKALESLRKYPLALYSGRECSILEGFGPTICKMLDKQLEIHRANNPGLLMKESDVDAYEKSILSEVKSILEQKQEEENEDQRKRSEIDALYRKYDIVESRATSSSRNHVAASSEAAAEFMPPKVKLYGGCFEIILLVDTQETAGYAQFTS